MKMKTVFKISKMLFSVQKKTSKIAQYLSSDWLTKAHLLLVEMLKNLTVICNFKMLKKVDIQKLFICYYNHIK